MHEHDRIAWRSRHRGHLVRYTINDVPGGFLFRFRTERGNVMVAVRADGKGGAIVNAAEEQAAMAQHRLDLGEDDDALRRKTVERPGRFGARLMLEMFRVVRRELPFIHRFQFTRHSGSNPGRTRVMEV